MLNAWDCQYYVSDSAPGAHYFGARREQDQVSGIDEGARPHRVKRERTSLSRPRRGARCKSRCVVPMSGKLPRRISMKRPARNRGDRGHRGRMGPEGGDGDNNLDQRAGRIAAWMKRIQQRSGRAKTSTEGDPVSAGDIVRPLVPGSCPHRGQREQPARAARRCSTSRSMSSIPH